MQSHRPNSGAFNLAANHRDRSRWGQMGRTQNNPCSALLAGPGDGSLAYPRGTDAGMDG